MKSLHLPFVCQPYFSTKTLRPWFQHPVRSDELVYVYPDAPHLLKVLRQKVPVMHDSPDLPFSVDQKSPLRRHVHLCCTLVS